MKKLSLAASVLLLSCNLYAAEELVTIKTRDGVEQRFLLNETTNAVATLVLFAGGKGALRLAEGRAGPTIGWGRNNFLVRSRNNFAAHGFTVAVVDAPSDRQGGQGMLGGFRASSEHVTDIDAVIAVLRQRSGLPVWLVGTSRGTESATWVAIHSRQSPDGLVLTSSMTVENNKGVTVPEMALDQIRVPVLVVAHRHDGCAKTPAQGADRIKNGLKQSPRVEVSYFEGGRDKGDPCKAKSHHGFLGIEDKVVARIAAFIKGH